MILTHLRELRSHLRGFFDAPAGLNPNPNFNPNPNLNANSFTRITSIRKKMASHASIKAYYDSKTAKNNYDDLYIKARDLPTSDDACEVQVSPKPNGCLKDLYSKVGRTTNK